MRKRYCLLFIVISLISIGLWKCSNNLRIAEPGDGNGSIVSVMGCIKSAVKDNQMVKREAESGIIVKLRPSGYFHLDPELQIIPRDTSFKTCSTMTDQNGMFRFDSVRYGLYSIEATSSEHLTFIDSIDVSRVTANTSSVVDVGTHQLAQPGGLAGTIFPVDSSVNIFVFIFGTDRFTQVNSRGDYRFDTVPAGLLRLQFLSDSTGYMSDTMNQVLTETGTIVYQDTLFSIIYRDTSASTGSTPFDQRRYSIGEPATIIGNIGMLRMDGFTFIGWKMAGNDKTYLPGDTLIISSGGIVLYSYWTSKPISRVFYYGNNNTGGAPPGSVDYEEGTEIHVARNFGKLEKNGFSFLGWNTMANGEGICYPLGSSFIIGATDVHLYAWWTKQPTCSVVYNGNKKTGGNVPVDEKVYLDGETGIIQDNIGKLVKIGYSFTGWNTAEDGSGKGYNAGDTLVMNTGAVQLYAQWVKKQYALIYNDNGSTSGQVPERKLYEYGSKVIVAGNTGKLYKGTASFTGWDTIQNGFKGGIVPRSMLIIDDDSITLYAHYCDSLVMDNDGNLYNTVTIGNQVWLRENLRTTVYNDGTSIPEVKDSVTWQGLTAGARCWYANDSAAYHAVYGVLYNWFAVATAKLAPAGWHVPTDAEWDTLVDYLGGDSIAGGKMKIVDPNLWKSPNMGADNSSGFSAVPSGSRDDAAGSFMFGGENGKWWCSSDDGHINSWFRSVRYEVPEVRRVSKLKVFGASIRCVRD